MKKSTCGAIALVICLTGVACHHEAPVSSSLRISVTDLSGTPVQLSFAGNQVTILNLWATWCVPCKAEIKNLIELNAECRTLGCTIIGVALDSITPEHLKPAIAALGIPYPVYTGNADEVLTLTGVSAIPATILFDQNGIIVKRLIGYHDKQELRKAIAEVISVAKPQLP